MWTFHGFNYLPCREADLIAAFGLPAGTAFNEIRPHAISAGGKYIGGNFTYTPPTPGAVQISSAFLIRRNHGPGFPQWTLESQIPFLDYAPGQTAVGMSVRGVNDLGDVVGFYVKTAPPPPQWAYIKTQGHKPVPIDGVGPPKNNSSTAWCIDNDRRVAGTYDAGAGPLGFVSKHEKDGSVAGTFYDRTSFPGKVLKSFNRNGDYIYTETIGGVSQEFLHIGDRDINITTSPKLTTEVNVTANGLNRDGLVAGFYGPVANRRAFLGSRALSLFDPVEWNHPDSKLKDTRLFAISDDGIAVGCYDKKNPFFLVTEYEMVKQNVTSNWF